MTFLNPLLLLALAAAAVPIVIHLLNLRKLKTVEFSSLQFLRELQQTTMRRLRLRQILLLILRTLLVILIVFAFSRPAFRESFGGILPSHARTTLVVLLDDSPSMGIRNERGTLLAQATQSLQHIIELAHDDDAIVLIPLSHVRSEAPVLPLHSRLQGQSLLRDMISPSQISIPLSEGVDVARKHLSDLPNMTRELYIVTDGQQSHFQSPQGTSTTRDDLDATVFLIETGLPTGANAGVVSTRVRSQVFTRSTPVVMEAELRSSSSTSALNLLVSGFLEGERVVQKTLDIPPSGTSIAQLSFLPKKRGILKGRIEVEDDLFESDNIRHFTVDVPSGIRILSVGSNAHDDRYVTLALTLGGDSLFADLLSVDRILRSDLSATALERYDVLLLAGVAGFTRTEAERIAGFVREGGGVMIFPGEESDLANYNETLFAHLGLPRAGTDVPDLRGTEEILHFDRVDYDHPILAGMFLKEASLRQARPRVESPRVYKALRANAGSSGQAIIRLSNGTPFLLEHNVGAGRVLLMAVDAAGEWSDFRQKGMFAPFMHRSMLYLVSHPEDARETIVGERLQMTLRPSAMHEKLIYSIRSPSGREERLLPRILQANGKMIFRSSPTEETGIYELVAGVEGVPAAVHKAVAVNIAAGESDLRRVSDEELATFWKACGISAERVRRLSTHESMEHAVLEARFGTELWKYLLVLALLTAVAEMIVGRADRKAREVSP